MFQGVDNEGFAIAEEGCSCVFFPNDIHRPGCCVRESRTIRKVVVKVHKNALER